MLRSRIVTIATLCFWMLSALPAANAQAGSAQRGERCFRETGYCISGRFREDWEANGGLPVFGFPIGATKNERNRLELHSENQAPYDVLLGRLGDDMLRAQGRSWQAGQGAESLRVISADGTGEQALRLDTGAFPGVLLDFAWRGNRLLVLTQDEPNMLSLFEAPLNTFHPAAATKLHTFEQNGQFGYQIVYVPS